jgi:hypothetical protein
MLARPWTWLLSVSLLGCNPFASLPKRDARCDLRPADAQCTDLRDFVGPSFFTFQGVCTTLTAAKKGGTYTEDARCDVTGSVGGCQSKDATGGQQTNWYYGISEADARAKCDSSSPFVPPTP